MNCLNCGKELPVVSTKPSKYCNDKCRMAFSRKNKDNAISGQKQGLENALQSIMSVDNEQVYAKLPEKTNKITNISGDSEQEIPNKIDSEQITNKPENFGLDNCQCMHCQTSRVNKSNVSINHGEYLDAAGLAANGYDVNRVVLPGDVDYVKPQTIDHYGKCKYCGKDLSGLSTAHLLECCYDCAIHKHTPQVQEAIQC